MELHTRMLLCLSPSSHLTFSWETEDEFFNPSRGNLGIYRCCRRATVLFGPMRVVRQHLERLHPCFNVITVRIPGGNHWLYYVRVFSCLRTHSSCNALWLFFILPFLKIHDWHFTSDRRRKESMMEDGVVCKGQFIESHSFSLVPISPLPKKPISI